MKTLLSSLKKLFRSLKHRHHSEKQNTSDKELLLHQILYHKHYLEYLNIIKTELCNIIDLPEKEQHNKIKNIYIKIQNDSNIFNCSQHNLNISTKKIYDDFSNRLEQKYSSMTKAEKRLFAMLYVNMSNKEISIITNTNIRSVETSRYRLRKKYNINNEEIANFMKDK